MPSWQKFQSSLACEGQNVAMAEMLHAARKECYFSFIVSLSFHSPPYRVQSLLAIHTLLLVFSPLTMKHKCSIESILINSGTCTPTNIGVNSWVTLQSSRNGEHTRDARKHKEEGGFLVKILKLYVKEDSRSIIKVLVQHACTHWQLQFDPRIHHRA